MCGIIVHDSILKHEEISHRGITHQTVECKGKFFTHYLLPIQTYAGSGEQPIYLKGGWSMLYNGELFGHKRDNDIQLIRDVFLETDIFDFLDWMAQQDGFWAVVLFHENGDIIFCTDPAGRKQLYYDNKNNICSELHPLRSGIINKACIAEIGQFGYISTSETVWEKVKKAHPGKIYQVRNFGIDCIGQVGFPEIKMEQDLVEQCYNLISESVNHRVNYTNRKVGVFLSGGLDSSIICSQIDPEKANFYSIENGPDEEHVDLLGVDFTRLYYRDYDLDDIIMTNQNPVDLGSMIPQYLLFRSAKEKVVITGDGADELFGGYRRSQYYDSQSFDIHELVEYHLPRIDKMSMKFTIESRHPFLSTKLISFATQLPYEMRKGKRILKEAFEGIVPQEIIHRKKYPLKSPDIVKDEKLNRYKLIERWMKLNS